MNSEASRPPAAMPASGPSQREAPAGLAMAPAAPAALAPASGALGAPGAPGAGVACGWENWRGWACVWCIGAAPNDLPPPKRLAAKASTLSDRLRHRASARLRNRCM